MLGTLNHDQIEEVLHSQLIGRIGCHSKDVTYIVPISYAYDGNYIYGLTREGLKIQIMRENPNVCFEVEKMENMANWQTVISWGEFTELSGTEERNMGIQKLLDRVLPLISSQTVHLSPHWPFAPNDLNNIEGIVFRIKLTTKTGRFESNEIGAYYAT